jgi:hypothetical protein
VYQAFEVLFASPYWFVPNLLIAICILLFLLRSIENLPTGILLFVPALFHSVNLYYHWLPIRHTTAFAGFAGYLWLGAWCARNPIALKAFIEGLSRRVLFCALLLCFSLSIGETYLLTLLHSTDPLDTLRITNQLFSLVVVLTFLKLEAPGSPGFINVREQTFGLYLTHGPVVSLVVATVKRITLLEESVLSRTVAGGLCIWAIVFALTYTSCVLITAVLSRHRRLSWTIGARGHAGIPYARSFAAGD